MWNPFKRRETDLDKELRFHVDQQTRDYMAEGVPAGEARRRARMDFGSGEQIKESCREVSSLHRIGSVLRNCRYNLRVLRRSPGFTAIAVLSLALGIGANTAVVQLLNAVLFRPLPIPDPDELAEIHIEGGTQGFGLNQLSEGLTYPMWEQIRDHQEPFSGVFAWAPAEFAVGEGEGVSSVPAAWVSGGAFETLGVVPARGRLFSTSDEAPGCSDNVVISYPFWQRQFGGSEEVVGSGLTINQTPFTVVGVAQPGFLGVNVGTTFEVALPFCVLETWAPGYLSARDAFWLWTFGRLSSGWTASSAATWLEASSVGWFEAAAPDNYTPALMDVWDSYRLTARPRPNGVSDLRTDYGTALWLLLGITGLVLAIACANLANLTLARTLARGREVATRLAIGAERRQVVWELFSESVLLTLAGSVAGAVLAGILSNALVGFLNSQNIEAVLDLEMDWNVLAALAASAFATCLFFGLSVAIYATREQTLAQAASVDRGSTPDRRRFSFQSILISGQVSVSLVLVASSFLFLKSFENLVTTDAGFRQEGIVYSYLDAGPDDGEAPARVNPEWVDAARSIPGVEAATTSTHRPLNGSGWSLGVRNPETGEDTFPQFTWVSPGYFETMAIPILAGRDITEDDGAGSRRVLLINERFARDYFGEADPIGNRLRSLEEPGFPETVYEVVGVVADTHYRSLRGGIRPIAYAPAAQEPSGQRPMAIVTRSSLPASSLAREVEAAIARVDPDVRTTGTVDLRQEVLQGLSRERILAWLGGFFGLLALTLAGIGLYGVVSYMVAARRREIGIRMALGADRSSVIGMVLGQTTRLTLVGCAGGVGLSLVVMRLAKGLLFGIVPSDPFALSGAATVLTVVALAAAYLPGRVAARTNPVETLRDG